MFNLSGSELIFLVLIALVVLGPDKLPEAMRKAGKVYADFKRMTSGFQSEMKSVLDEPMRELRETAELAKKAAMFDPNQIDTKPAVKPVSATMAAVTPASAAAVPITAVDSPASADAPPAGTPAPAIGAGESNGGDATSRRLAGAQAPSAEPAAGEPAAAEAADSDTHAADTPVADTPADRVPVE